jgi:hypothetical protein
VKVFKGDSTVPRVKNGLDASVELANRNSLELNERGPALNVFWSRLRRDGHRETFNKSPES